MTGETSSCSYQGSFDTSSFSYDQGCGVHTINSTDAGPNPTLEVEANFGPSTVLGLVETRSFTLGDSGTGDRLGARKFRGSDNAECGCERQANSRTRQ